MFIRNTWYVAGWGTEVPAHGLFARTIIGTPVLLYRQSAPGGNSCGSDWANFTSSSSV